MFRIDSLNYIVEAGKRLFSEGPPATTVPANYLNSVQEEIAYVIEQAGLQLYPSGETDTRKQLWEAIQRSISTYDIVVTSQAIFNSIIERTGPNAYRIKSEYTSVYVKPVTGGYGLPLSGGDVYGVLTTNACAHLEFQNGSFINVSATISYLEVDTADCYLKNVWIKGDSTQAAIVQSFLLNAVRVTYDNCKCSTRNSSVDMVGFQGSGTALHNITSKYIGCYAFTLDGGDKVNGFKDCMNLSVCVSYDIEGTTDEVYGFRDCNQLSDCVAYQLDCSIGSFGFYDCLQVSSCRAEDIDSSGAGAIGFRGCERVSGCYAFDIDGAGGNAAGFSLSNQVSSCKAFQIDYSGGGASNAYGFVSCFEISACKADDIDVNGAGSAEAFSNCQHGSSLDTSEAVNSGNDYMDTVDAQITNKVSIESFFT